MSTQQIGLITEKQCELAFVQHNCIVSIPNYYNSRYDMLIDVEGNIYKIQIKTCRITPSQSGIEISTCSHSRNVKGHRRIKYSKTEVDFFATFWNEKCYLFPIEICQGRKRVFTFEKEINCQYLSDYELEKVLFCIKNKQSIITEYKPVKQYDPKTNLLINEFSSLVEAVKSIKGETANRSHASHILDVINGKRKTAYGYIWERE